MLINENTLSVKGQIAFMYGLLRFAVLWCVWGDVLFLRGDRCGRFEGQSRNRLAGINEVVTLSVAI
jgi:hypothetical protein